jgi:thiamine biosynthesis protein ThiI
MALQKILMAKCGELALKGLNRGKFEQRLVRNLKQSLKDNTNKIEIKQSTIYIEPNVDCDFYLMREKVKKVFGLTSVSIVYKTEKNIERIKEEALLLLKEKLQYKTFKVEAKRAEKSFPLSSPEICMEVGGHLFSNIPNTKVDVKNPSIIVKVEIREENAYIYFEKEECFGGLPTGTAGKASLLLSGGIDSPVAGFMMAKRGLELNCIHFYSYPYTSERAKQKVLSLSKILGEYTGGLNVYIVPFTQIQLEINQKCSNDMATIIMRRFMMKISEQIAIKTGSQALITGESLGQVASQTIEGITATNNAVEIPVLRPLIGMDKNEITIIARKIGSFETSILPYEDCCTVFTPKHPKTKPTQKDVIIEEQRLDIKNLIDTAIENIEIL